MGSEARNPQSHSHRAEISTQEACLARPKGIIIQDIHTCFNVTVVIHIVTVFLYFWQQF